MSSMPLNKVARLGDAPSPPCSSHRAARSASPARCDTHHCHTHSERQTIHMAQTNSTNSKCTQATRAHWHTGTGAQSHTGTQAHRQHTRADTHRALTLTFGASSSSSSSGSTGSSRDCDPEPRVAIRRLILEAAAEAPRAPKIREHRSGWLQPALEWLRVAQRGVGCGVAAEAGCATGAGGTELSYSLVRLPLALVTFPSPSITRYPRSVPATTFFESACPTPHGSQRAERCTSFQVLPCSGDIWYQQT